MTRDEDPLGLKNEHGGVLEGSRGERGTRWVTLLTAAMMVVELAVGQMTGSMSLVADGWHMATHVGAIGLAAAAYWFARSRAKHRAFTFGTGKVYALAGFTSAISLAMVALIMVVESTARLRSPIPVRFDEALPVAVVGLLVNLMSALLLGGGHAHDRDDAHDDAHDHEGHDHEGHDHEGHDHEGHDHEHGHVDGHEHDHNLKAAYLHVVADAFTSVLAIGALVAGRYAGLPFLDPLMGVIGGAVILRWGWQLARESGATLVDAGHAVTDEERVRELIESEGASRVVDLHVWELGPGRRSCVVTVATEEPRDARYYRELIRGEVAIAHLTVEVHVTRG